MATVPKALVRTTVFNGTEVAVTCPPGKRWVVTNMLATPIAGAAAVAYVSLGGYSLLYGASLPAGVLYNLSMSQVLEAGEKISLGMNTAVAVHISGVEMDA